MFALTASQRRFCEMTYKDVELLIYKTARQFRAKYGGDLDDLISVANLCFLEVYQKPFDARKSKFSTWLRTKVWYALLSDRRKKAVRASRETATDWENIPENLYSCDAEESRWQLSEDAEMLIKAALSGQVKSSDALMGIACEDRGWSWERLTEGWKEVQEAIS